MALSYKIHDLDLNEAQQKLRDGIFNMNTRRFGKVAEYMIARQYGLSVVEGKTNYDLTDEENTRIEVKFSRVEFKEEDLTLENCLRVCMDNALPQLRRVACEDATSGEVQRVFNSNIQQIKAFEFDRIYYGLFFDDQIAIFSMSSKEMKDIMTAQYFVSKSKTISPKTDISKTLEMIETDDVEDDVVYQSLIEVQNKFQYIVDTRNPYAGAAQEYVANHNMKEPWDNIIFEIEDNNRMFQEQHIERLRDICRRYFEFCDAQFPVTERVPDTSPFQHRGNDKAEGQMHFTEKNFTWHIEESGHFCGWLSYKDLYELLSEVAE